MTGIYHGTLRHRRFSPRRHEFTYRLFMVLMDIDRIDEMMQVSRFTSVNRFNWATFDHRDHFGDPSRPLRARLATDAARQGLDLPDGSILLLTHLRYLGYCFNPVSFFYCFDASNRLRLVLAEVNNTFGGSQNYWLTAPGTAHTAPGTDHGAPSIMRPAPATVLRASLPKTLYVSPFMKADAVYRFALTPPADSLVVHMATLQNDVPVFDATLYLERRDWSASQIRHALLSHPWMTATVIAGIYFEAVKLWWKGVPVVPRETDDGHHPVVTSR